MPAQKRKAPETPASSDRRRSGRISSSGQKSKYFEADSDSEEDELGDDYKFEDSDEPKASTNGSHKKRGRGRPSQDAVPTSRRKSGGGKKAKIELDDDDDDVYAEQESEEKEKDDEDDEDDFETNRYTITPLIKMRDLGGVPYEDDRLHKNTLLFLKDLKANNERSWLKCKLYSSLVPPDANQSTP